jgi:hypothetical protein
MTATTRIIFIAGSGRSGSTILDRLLSASPGAFGGGEVGNFWNAVQPAERHQRTCGCGQLVHSCEFWRAVLERAFGPFDSIPVEHFRALRANIDRSLLRMRLPGRADPEIEEFREVLARFYEGVAAVSGAKTIIDSTKHSTYGWLLARARGVRLSALQLVRDSRAVSFSWARDVPSSLPLRLRRMPVRDSAWLWNRENIAAEVLRLKSEMYIRLRYEDFTAEPGRRLDELGRRLDLSPPRLSDTNSITLPSNHMVTGNPVRFRNDEITIREDDEWKTSMTSRDARLVTAITLPLLLRYGYPIRYRPEEL